MLSDADKRSLSSLQHIHACAADVEGTIIWQRNKKGRNGQTMHCGKAG